MTAEYKASLNVRPLLPAAYGSSFKDAARNHRNRFLTNEEVMFRVKDAIQKERATRSIEQHRTDATIAHHWNAFLRSKLVNPTHNKII